MPESIYKGMLVVAALFFTAFFTVTVLPPLFEKPDIWGAFAAGFVNPYSSGYSTDVLVCWVILAVWVAYEAKAYEVRKGWICLLLGIVPGWRSGLRCICCFEPSKSGSSNLIRDDRQLPIPANRGLEGEV
ncbi:DUF2834 domain-containing protein [Alloalcanivorax profundimaris]|uniref:DUF2834 domain-containing protein n=1 Tax=Alloalcanivorax profundimaris TaxID=2735259 RepID=UPI001E3DF2D7|nr:DUF2834 domain-containing protein [Alloalcanivorax profundimaris]MCQ6262521.1 DUF2834 domain-containing protein [Alcanivorax sp. MM125-6]